MSSAGADIASAEQRLLFLDFDGCMHPFGCAIDRYFCHLELLEAWLRRRPCVVVVISSSWRENHPLDEMQSYFSDDIQNRLIGTTPVFVRDTWAQFDIERQPHTHTRYIEILRWLAQNSAQGKRWAAVDDQAHLFTPDCDSLVLVDGRVGLTTYDLARADNVLGI